MTPESEQRLFLMLGAIDERTATLVDGQRALETRVDALEKKPEAAQAPRWLTWVASGIGVGATAALFKLLGITPAPDSPAGP